MRRSLYVLAMAAIVLLVCLLLPRLPIPNPLWGMVSGYYSYDPRQETPPASLFRERVEPSLAFFLDATLKACEGVYPSGQTRHVSGYAIEQVEYMGKTSYHAYALVHVRLAYAMGETSVAVFRLEAGHNESYMLESSSVRAGSWIAREGLVVPESPPPPGWLRYPGGNNPTTCIDAGQPYSWRPK